MMHQNPALPSLITTSLRTVSLRVRFCFATAVLSAFILLATDTSAQQSTGTGNGNAVSSRNITLVAHHPLGGIRSVEGSTTGGFRDHGRRTGDVALDQNPNRPFAYVAKRYSPSSLVALDLTDDRNPIALADWALMSDHSGPGITNLTLFQSASRHFIAVATQVGEEGAYGSNAVVILDVSDVADGTMTEVARIQAPGGYGRVFAYRHSDGRSLLFGAGGNTLDVYDLDVVLQGESAPIYSLVIPIEVPNVEFGFNDMHAAYHVESEKDRLYASGAGGFYVYDVTDPETPSLLASVSSAAVQIGDAVAATPDGSTIVTTAGYRASPLRIFDLQPALDGTVTSIRTATGAWVADWRNRTSAITVRWPFIFAASMEDGFQVVNMHNPIDLYTAGFYKTWTGKTAAVSDQETDRTGAVDVDVRNYDGLIVVTDANTGFWAFRMDGFQGWDGRGWGLPNISSVQNWQDGPIGAGDWPPDEGSIE